MLLEPFRVRDTPWGPGDHTCGAFLLPPLWGAANPDAGLIFPLELRVIFSEGDGWEHASVSTETRCPSWYEMKHVRDLLWQPHECVVQYHPPVHEYVNHHPHCLHMWRPTGAWLVQPPSYLLGAPG